MLRVRAILSHTAAVRALPSPLRASLQNITTAHNSAKRCALRLQLRVNSSAAEASAPPPPQRLSSRAFEWVVDHPRLFFGSIAGALLCWLLSSLVGGGRRDGLAKRGEGENALSPKEIATLCADNKISAHTLAAVADTLFEHVAQAQRKGEIKEEHNYLIDVVGLLRQAVALHNMLKTERDAAADTAALAARFPDMQAVLQQATASVTTAAVPLKHEYLLWRAADVAELKQTRAWRGLITGEEPADADTTTTQTNNINNNNSINNDEFVQQPKKYPAEGTFLEHALSPTRGAVPILSAQCEQPLLPYTAFWTAHYTSPSTHLAAIRQRMLAERTQAATAADAVMDPLSALLLVAATLGVRGEPPKPLSPEQIKRAKRPFWAVLVPTFLEERVFGPDEVVPAAPVAIAPPTEKTPQMKWAETLQNASGNAYLTPTERLVYCMSLVRRWKSLLGSSFGEDAPSTPDSTHSLVAKMIDAHAQEKPFWRLEKEELNQVVYDAQDILDAIGILILTHQISPRFRPTKTGSYPLPTYGFMSPEKHLVEALREVELLKNVTVESSVAATPATPPAATTVATASAVGRWREHRHGLPPPKAEESAICAKINRQFTGEEVRKIMFSRAICAWGECTAYDMQPMAWLRASDTPATAPAAGAPGAAPAATPAAQT